MEKMLNGILFGSTGAGKTSLIRMLEDPTYAVESVSVYSTTKYPTSHVISVDWEPHSTSYQLKMIDTPGLQKIRCLSDAQKNESIIEEIRQFLINEKMTHLSFIGLVVNVDQISSEEIKAFKQLRHFLGETLVSQTILIFTHCEEKLISNDFNCIDEKYRTLIEYAQLGRIYTGLLHSDIDKVKDLSSQNQTLFEQRIRTNIFKMRHTFLEKVFNNCTSSVPIPESWFERVSTSSSHTASNLSEQYGAVSSMQTSSEASQRQTGCCAKYFKWCKCQRCVDYYLLMAFFLFCTLVLYLFKYLWIFLSSSVGYISNQFRDLLFVKPKAQQRKT